MDKFWSVFWKLFAAACVAVLVLSVILGIVFRSVQVTFDIILGIFAISMGVCGVIGMIVIPIEMYITYRLNRMKNPDTEIAAAVISGGKNDVS